MSQAAVDVESVTERLRSYYTRYYRDTLGIPSWGDLVAVRIREEEQEAHRLKRLESLLGSPIAGLRLLNVGCGTGGFNVVAERAGLIAWGVDTDPEAVEIARLKTAGLSGGVMLAAAEALPFEAESFDLVYCFSTLEHVRDEARAVAEMVRMVRSGGAVYLHAPNAWSCYEGHYKIFWLPRMSRFLARWYLKLRGRPARFVESLTPLTPGRLERRFSRAGARVTRFRAADATPREAGSPLWPFVRTYYRLFGIEPSIELLAWKTASSGF
jgi:SAM-dependent methyltransferase